MKIKILILTILLSTKLFGQNDTTIYFSGDNSPVQTIEEASYYQTLIKSPKNKYVLSTFRTDGDNWKKTLEDKIVRQTDTSFIINSSSDDYIRFFRKLDNGFMIHDIIRPNSNGTYHTYYNWEGFSYTLFPLIRSGAWRSYSIFTGDLQFEELYHKNNLISSKLWINDSTFINDVFRYLSEPPKFKGGQEALNSLIYNNIDYPAQRVHGTVIISFIILSNGQIVGIKPLNKTNKEMTQEVIRLVNLTRNKWIPAKRGDIDVNSVMYLPVTFGLR